MREEPMQSLTERWPSWFNIRGDIRETRMPDGFAHGDGWFKIIWKLSGDLEPLVEETEKVAGQPFEILRVKEKFGRLRFYTSHTADALRRRIETARTESLSTREIGAQPGSRREHRWTWTVCDDHDRDERETAKPLGQDAQWGAR